METLKKVPGWAEQVLFPKLNSIERELKAIHTRINSIEKSVGELDKRLSQRMDLMHSELKAEIRSAQTELKADIRVINEKVDVLPRLAVLEAKMKELERRK
jgi:archaellum component FlaC